MSMGIVGVNSTVGRAVKCIDPGKTTKSESSWLGYSLCDLIVTPLPGVNLAVHVRCKYHKGDAFYYER